MAREQPYEDLTDEQVIENVSFIYHNETRKVRKDVMVRCEGKGWRDGDGRNGDIDS